LVELLGFQSANALQVGHLQGVAQLGGGDGQQLLDQPEVPLGLPQPSGVHGPLGGPAEVGDLAVQQAGRVPAEAGHHVGEVGREPGQELFAACLHPVRPPVAERESSVAGAKSPQTADRTTELKTAAALPSAAVGGSAIVCKIIMPSYLQQERQDGR
jgi:hypothetical protein